MQHRPRSGSWPRLAGRIYALLLMLTVALGLASALGPAAPTYAASAPPNFQVTAVVTGLKNPTDFQFAADGRLFVAEKAGTIKVFDSVTDTSPTVFADLSTQVYKGPNDHGLLGIALDPSFPSTPYVYVLYTYDAPIGSTAPRWNDVCPDPPGSGTNGCVVSGRLSRLQAAGNVMTGSEQVLVAGWCQQFTSHSIGALGFGADGALYASAGEGANTSRGDYGQVGNTDPAYTTITPLNPCGDPPGAVGTALTAPSSEGGALRAQSPRRLAGEPVLLSGTLIRVDPATGAGLPGNPLSASADANARRIVAYGLRNPFRLTIRPGTSDVWIGDVGWGAWEEIDRVSNPTSSSVANFGWPCYEGNSRQPAFDGINLKLCEDLYSTPNAVTAPYHTYSHREILAAGETCSDAVPCTSAITGLAFYQGGNYPAIYDGALFFADYSRHGIYVMSKGANGLPDPATRAPFITAAGNPVSLHVGPNGDLFYADLTGTIYRVSYYTGNQPPLASAQANQLSGAVPLSVTFDGTESSDPDGDPISYGWDLDGDGQYDDSTAATPSRTYTQPGSYTIGLKVTDSNGASAIATVTIAAGNSAPHAVIDTPASSLTWKVGDPIHFTGHATDAQDGVLPPEALAWTVLLHHCYTPTDCHIHTVEDYNGVAGGAFPAPDHEDLAYIEIQLTATDSGALQDTASVLIGPLTTTLNVQSTPPGMQLALDTGGVTTPASHMVMAGSSHQLIAPEIQNHRSFSAWADGDSARVRQILVATTPQTYTATYINKPPSALLSAAPNQAPFTVDFSAALATDPEGDALSYSWEFGDGELATAAAPAHRYAEPGTYHARLTMADTLGASASRSITLAIDGQGKPTVLSRLINLPLTRR
jgi:glucose/arabinose dehydrogenase/PKD repeat protein